MAQLTAKGRLNVGDDFVHESIIGSLFRGRVEGVARVGNREAIALYRGAGFDAVGIRRDYYADPPEDALILRRAGLGAAAVDGRGNP